MAKKGSKITLDPVNAHAELERIGWSFEPSGQSEYKLCCPSHDDKNPSATLNTESKLWRCHTCKAGGDIATFLAFAQGITRQEVIKELSNRYDLNVKKTLNPATIEAYYKEIFAAGPLLQKLYDRGITDTMIHRARLGFNANRITIPVYDESRRIVNLRRYLPGAPSAEKMRNTPGYGGNQIYQIEQLKFNTVWICGGEMKALVASELLNPHGIGAVSTTGGEGSWQLEFSDLFKGKKTYICFDTDHAGMEGARKIAGWVGNFVQGRPKIIQLPLDRKKYPAGDINDYVGKEGATDKDLLKLMEEATEWVAPTMADDDDHLDAIKVNLAYATNAKFVAKKIETNAIVTSMDTTPYLIPDKVDIKCSKDQPYCDYCPVRAVTPNTEGKMPVHVRGTSLGMLSLINCPEKGMKAALNIALSIPCKVAEHFVKSYQEVYDCRLTPQLNIGAESSKNILQPGFLVAPNIDMNTPYVLTGKNYPQPKNQQAVLLMGDVEAGEDNLDEFKPSEEELAELKVFQPDEWTIDALKAKLDHIYEDIETNVTRIFHRRNLHLVLDLSFHSVLNFKFDDREIKGWTNVLIAGDSSQGKSEASLRLQEHYGLGERVECKNATVAGLLGGLHQVGNRWFISWGVIPMHDRRLVILEEIKGTDPEVLAKLTDMRSSGIAQISKIEKRTAYARTRLIMISNPRSGRSVSAYTFGIEIIKELLEGLEDVRRLDLALILSTSQIDPKLINKLSVDRPKVEHVYQAKQSQRLVLWAWTRKAEQTIFDADATQAILQYATKMSDEYTESVPLVDRGTMRHKLARLAAALAARTYSTDDSVTVRVRKCHVDYIYEFLKETYDNEIFGYKAFSEAQKIAHQIKDPEDIKKKLCGTKHAADLVDNMLYTDQISLIDLSDWCENGGRDESRSLLSFLVRKRALYRKNRNYYKTSKFIKLLKDMRSDGVKQVPHIEDTEEF